MATTGLGPPAPAPLPLSRPRFFTWKRGLLYLALVGLSCVALSWLATYFLGERGTAELTECNSGGRGSKGCSVVYTTDGGERGTDSHVSVRNSDEPGDTIPIKVRDGEVIDARFGANDLIVLGPMVLIVLSTVVCLGTPPALAALRSSRRSRAERALRERGEQPLRITVHESDAAPASPGGAAPPGGQRAEAARVTGDDGTPYASSSATHPGPAYPPSAASFDVRGPDGRPRYTVQFRMPDHRRPEVVVYAPDGTVRAVVRRQLLQQAHADIRAGGDAEAAPLATVRPADRLGVERAITLPGGERVGTLLALPTAPGPTLLGLRAGVPEPLLAGALGLALARERFYPRPWLESADGRWAKNGGGQLGLGKAAPMP